MAVEDVILRYKLETKELKRQVSELKSELKSVEDVAEQGSKKSQESFKGLTKAVKTAGIAIVATIGIAAARAFTEFAQDIKDATLEIEANEKSSRELTFQYKALTRLLASQVAPAFDEVTKSTASLLAATNSFIASNDPQKWRNLFNTILNIAQSNFRALEKSIPDLAGSVAEGNKEVQKLLDEIQKDFDKKEIARQRKEKERREKFNRQTKNDEARALREELDDIDNFNRDRIDKEEDLLDEVTRLRNQFDEEQQQREEENNDFYFQSLQARAAAEKEVDELIFEQRQQRLEFLATSLSDVTSAFTQFVGENANAQKALLIFEKAASIANILVTLSRTLFQIRANAAAIPPIIPPGIPNPAFVAAQALAASQAAFAKISAGIQIAAITATAIPQFQSIGEENSFATGKIRITGKGTRTSDDIFARLSVGESVMTADETDQHYGALVAMRKRKFDDYIMADYLPKLANKNADFASKLATSLGYDNNGRDMVKLMRHGNRLAAANNEKLIRAILQNTKRRGW